MSETPSVSATIDRENPWPGLASFTEEARGFFFGREKETEELTRLVKRQTLTVLFGQSGLGKSSLLQAGLFPILRESDHLPLYLRLDHSADVAGVFEAMMAVPILARRLATLAGGVELAPEQMARLAALVFLHDFGKANRGFRARWLKDAVSVGHVQPGRLA